MSLQMRDARRSTAAKVATALAAIVAVCSLSACATSGAFSNGQKAEFQSDYDRAVIEYTRAAQEKPNNLDITLALDRAKLRAAEMHFSRGRRLAATGELDEALNELQIANELNPTSGDIQAELRRTRAAVRNKIAVSADGKTQLESLVESTRDQAPEGLALPNDVKLPPSFVFREASSRDIIVTLARYGNLNVVFDPAFREAPVTTELRNVSLEDALTSITSSTRTFYKVTAPRTITIVPDTPAKRREYEDEIVRTFFLSNADLKETIDLLRIVVDLRRIAGLPATNAITIKDSPDRVAAASRILAAIDKARPEVVIDVELLEVDRKRMRDLGLQIASPGNPPTGIDGSMDVNRQGLTLDNLRHLTAADVFVTGVPGLYYRLIKTDQTTRALANPQLRTAEGIAAQARFGERVPVPVTTFAPIATGGVPQQPVTSFNYENIGVNIDITPRMHHNDDVSLALKVEVSAVSGVGFGGLPTFANRFINTVIRLKDGETNMLAGLIRDDERHTLDGVPGLTDLPIVGRLFARNRKETQQTDIILTITPHIVRVLDLHESDLRPFRLGREGAPGLGLVPQLQVPEQPPAEQTPGPPPPPQPQQPQPQGPQPIRPILPPPPATPPDQQEPPPPQMEEGAPPPD
jgi:general secretion pathway protein D